MIRLHYMGQKQGAVTITNPSKINLKNKSKEISFASEIIVFVKSYHNIASNIYCCSLS